MLMDRTSPAPTPIEVVRTRAPRRALLHSSQRTETSCTTRGVDGTRSRATRHTVLQ